MLTLGSLFDGIGGFPLSGAMHGIKPIWASEIEPFPILVTSKRFPEMRHVGSVTDIKGDQVEPVDILTFGSPCQDLSVAGAQKGIHEGARSSLFFEAVRIIKEMRNNDKQAGRTGKHVRPRFAVWENVPGAYSSNKGRDFQAVLQALCEVADSDVHVPFPQSGKWQKAGCIVGDGYSVAWRTLDANISQGHRKEENASTLSQILVPNAPEKYYLSRTACEGILRRAAKRGKELPKMLKDALEEVVALR